MLEEEKKNRSTRIRTMNTQTFLKREICRWNKLLELSADHFSREKKEEGKRRGGPGRGSETRNIKINRFGTQKE